MDPIKLTIAEYETEAHTKMDKMALDYYRSGADDEITLRANREAFLEFRIIPRFLRDVSRIKMNTFELFGHKMTCPIGVSPTAMQKLANPDGELATAKAVNEFGTIMILSTLSSTSIEDIAEAQPNLIKLFQLYLFLDRNESLSMIRRAEKAGFKALVLTVDAPQFGLRRRDIRNNFKVASDFLANFRQNNNQSIHQLDYIDAGLNWSDINWLKQNTKLPIFLKGILSPEDAQLAIDHGVDGLVVSNHGGRQLDCAPASIEVLPHIARVVQGRIPILIDGGVRTGSDVFKCLAMGADMVFVGRPILWGLACDGCEGVSKILNMLRNELETVMRLAGCPTLSDINHSMVVHKNQLIPKFAF